MFSLSLGLAETSRLLRLAHISMKWLRANIRVGSRLALLSLLIQFALSFGHFHGVSAQAALIVQSVFAQSDTAKIDGGDVTDAGDHWVRQQQPSSDHDRQSPGDPCAICAIMALANTVLFATPPALPLPSADVEFTYQPTETKLVRLNTVTAFQPRGPPAS
jgi:hypothetical protein